jgi:predicted transcriptional regulator
VEDALRRESQLPLVADDVVEIAASSSQLKAALPADLILNILRNSPCGLTAKEVADQLGGKPSNIGSRLSKLAAYGIIKQSRVRTAPKASPCALYTFPILIAA